MTDNSTPKAIPFGHSILKLNAQEEEDSFHGSPYDLGWGRLYGGHLIAQALFSIYQRYPNLAPLNSFHAYFLHVGNTRHTIEYKPQALRMGRRLSSFRVQATQNQRSIFEMLASTAQEGKSPSHQRTMPTVPPPHECGSEQEMFKELLPLFSQSKGLKQFVNRRLESNNGLEIRPISPSNFLYTKESGNKRLLWFKMSSFEEQYLLRILLAYVSDFLLVGTSLQPHKLSVITPRVKFASIDHSMWFYQKMPQNEWILLEAESQILYGAQCLVHGHFFTHTGSLIASCSQEALVQV